ncbi:EAL and HDOD domain-containing protein [Marinobacterium mangrovicola]|uniref:EAL and modified HD-GYP domain-containing signal transduction protein n=1 Tax=Marinobacterium mangrovicola TaxID=1476959 RepID=A0A4V2PEK1_9GAMM|nr:HDOD domain-containing protein [Marinobacterium mangrovicola]TCK09406.1 EAL and modified HD-GYP domain-containing signal transduction protein [Marinobacterium mangrovicola]
MPQQIDPNQALVARHPIFDSHQRVIAYELSYQRDTALDGMLAPDPDTSSGSEVILSTYTSISDQGEIKRVPAFLPVSAETIATMPDLPVKQVVLTLTLPAKPDRAFAQLLLDLAKKGYRLTLAIREYRPELDPFIKLVKIVKLDIQNIPTEKLASQANSLAQLKVTALAANIKTIEQLELCASSGFKLFEGSFLSRPKVVKGKRIGANQVALMQLIQELQKPNVKPEILEEMIIRDPVLTYKLLRIVNSAAYSLVRKVESVAEAVVLLGIDQVRKWATLISMTSSQDKPEELSRTLLIRGRMCEIVAEGEQRPNPGSYFMAGMMSGLHVMLDVDRDTMLEQVPLGEDIKDAISGYKGDIGSTLQQALAYESGDWEKLPADFNIALFESAYRNSLNWARDAMQAMHE